jgi:lipopolysaccharide export system permease protein
MRVYIKFLVLNFLKSLVFVSSVIYTLIFILNIFTEFEFFREIDVQYYFPIYLSLINSPSLLFEMFPFIFLISSQVCFINLMKNDQIQTFKYSGLKNSKILFILSLTSFLTGLAIIGLFYNLSSNLKNIYLDLKNNYTSDDKYLAVITNNGLWIKDNIDGKIKIINASKIDGEFLVEASITELDEEFSVKRHIETEKIDISNNKWLVFNPKIFSSNEKNEFDLIYVKSNFDYERIQSLFSNLSSLSIFELFQLKKNYNLLNLSTTEIRLQIQKILSYPFYLCLMSILASIIMFNFKMHKNNTLKISFGLFLSVLIYYINNFLYVLGQTEKINVIFSVWVPISILIMINFIYTLKINEK